MKYLLLLFLFSCAGYNFENNLNPLKQYSIERVSLPMFVNHSIIPHIGAVLTKEVYGVLSRYPRLKVSTGFSKDSDAVLIGIVESDQRRKQTFKTTSTSFITGESLGQRNPMYVPISTSYKIRLRFILIKNPKKQELALLKSPVGNLIPKSDRVIFNEVLEFDQGYSRRIFDTLSPDNGGVVNFTNNLGNFERSLDDLGEQVALRLEREILHAF